MTAMQISVRSDLEYNVTAPTSFVFNIAAAETDRQRIIEESYEIEPQSVTAERGDMINGENRLLRAEVSPGLFKVSYHAVVELSPKIEDREVPVKQDYNSLPPETLGFINPSRYCPSDRLVRWAYREFGGRDLDVDTVEAVCSWIHERMEYLPGTTDSRTDAIEALVQCAGVCRDYAHIGISFCRALGIPARYVSGYAVDLNPPDFHGFFEVFLGDSWYLFDATEKAPRKSFVRIGTGRDAADCAFCNIVGVAHLTSMQVFAEHKTGQVSRLEDAVISTA